MVKTLEGEKVPAKKEQLSALLGKIFKRKKFKLQYECERLGVSCSCEFNE